MNVEATTPRPKIRRTIGTNAISGVLCKSNAAGSMALTRPGRSTVSAASAKAAASPDIRPSPAIGRVSPNACNMIWRSLPASGPTKR